MGYCCIDKKTMLLWLYIVISFLGHYSTKTEMGNYFIF